MSRLRPGLSHQQWHTSSSNSPAQNPACHDILDRLWIDHQPEPVHSPFQHPTQKLHERLAWLQELHVPRSMVCPMSSVNSFTLAHNHVVVHVTHGPHALTNIAVHTGISCTLDQSEELLLDFRRVVTPGGRSALQTQHGLEQTPSSSKSRLSFRGCNPHIVLLEKGSLEKGSSTVPNRHSQSQSLRHDQQQAQRGGLWCRTAKVLLPGQLLLIPSSSESRLGRVIVVFIHPTYRERLDTLRQVQLLIRSVLSQCAPDVPYARRTLP